MIVPMNKKELDAVAGGLKLTLERKAQIVASALTGAAFTAAQKTQNYICGTDSEKFGYICTIIDWSKGPALFAAGTALSFAITDTFAGLSFAVAGTFSENNLHDE